MEDPIFDPWSTDVPDGDVEADDDQGAPPAEPSESVGSDAPRGEPSRWRSPAMRPITKPRRVRPTSDDVLGATTGQAHRDTVVLTARPASVQTPTGSPAGSQPQGCPARERAERLREMLLPRLEWLTGRLQTAGHKSAIDDRLDAEEPLVRIRFAPRAAPVARPRRVVGSVLELAIDDSKSEIISRIWLDPLRVEPSEEIRIRQSKASVPWLNRVLLDFVEKTLAAA